MDEFSPIDYGGSGSPIPDEPFTLSEIVNFDSYSEASSPIIVDQILSSLSFSSAQRSAGIWTAFQAPRDLAQGTDFTLGDSSISDGACYNEREKMATQNPDLPQEHLSDCSSLEVISRRACCFSFDNMSNEGVLAIPRPLLEVSFGERMNKALSLIKDSSGSGILAQVWMPIKQDNQYVLSTSEQPFLLDQTLAGYREVSKQFTFSPREGPGLFTGLPGRVYISGMPEWTSNVIYYKKLEYLRVDHAVCHEVRGSIAVPVFDPYEGSCRAVLEIVTTREKPNFCTEMETVCNALQAVNLRTTKSQTHRQQLTQNQISAFSEMHNVLRSICQTHMLPLALTWVPIWYDGGNTSGFTKNDIVQRNPTPRCPVLCIQESACCVNDVCMQGFLHACAEHRLEKGQGIAGKALLSNLPFFCPDVKGYDIYEYPLAHHARKFNLHAAVAIRLSGTYTGNDDYILEFFLPVNCRGNEEQQLLLHDLSSTTQRILRSLRTFSDDETADAKIASVGTCEGTLLGSSSTDLTMKCSQLVDTDSETIIEIHSGSQQITPDELDDDAHHEQLKSISIKQIEKKRSTVEKNISLSILQRYFSGSLKDAAKSIGVCPTTLKRICRQHGISRWPSRKINKVNRSLQKIQNVINSVQGVEGTLKFDPSTGCLVAAVSTSGKPALTTVETNGCDIMPIFHHNEQEHSAIKVDPDYSSLGRSKSGTTRYQLKRETGELGVFSNDCMGDLKFTSPDVRPLPYANMQGAPGLSFVTFDKMRINAEVDEGNIEHSRPSCSSMTDSSSGSASSHTRSKKSKTLILQTGPSITVKATYKDDTVRFKSLLSMGSHHLFEEIGKRFKLLTGTFQVKYKDDEEEWVMLENDADLQECVDIFEIVGSRSLKLQVREIPCNAGSSASSSCLKI